MPGEPQPQGALLEEHVDCGSLRGRRRRERRDRSGQAGGAEHIETREDRIAIRLRPTLQLGFGLDQASLDAVGQDHRRVLPRVLLLDREVAVRAVKPRTGRRRKPRGAGIRWRGQVGEPVDAFVRAHGVPRSVDERGIVDAVLLTACRHRVENGVLVRRRHRSHSGRGRRELPLVQQGTRLTNRREVLGVGPRGERRGGVEGRRSRREHLRGRQRRAVDERSVSGNGAERHARAIRFGKEILHVATHGVHLGERVLRRRGRRLHLAPGNDRGGQAGPREMHSVVHRARGAAQIFILATFVREVTIRERIHGLDRVAHVFGRHEVPVDIARERDDEILIRTVAHRGRAEAAVEHRRRQHVGRGHVQDVLAATGQHHRGCQSADRPEGAARRNCIGHMCARLRK